MFQDVLPYPLPVISPIWRQSHSNLFTLSRIVCFPLSHIHWMMAVSQKALRQAFSSNSCSMFSISKNLPNPLSTNEHSCSLGCGDLNPGFVMTLAWSSKAFHKNCYIILLFPAKDLKMKGWMTTGLMKLCALLMVCVEDFTVQTCQSCYQRMLYENRNDTEQRRRWICTSVNLLIMFLCVGLHYIMRTQMVHCSNALIQLRWPDKAKTQVQKKKIEFPECRLKCWFDIRKYFGAKLFCA